ncbi:1-acyl-sn-glycerol-3-phosphate acyltransferase [mine drainage metagenome]|uniref:1-acyl-sn-glycerol-3-phosphate acyltransferase n=1 Tax=mine drainage metagenome TaxID=410659 RepID=A0A1J5SEF5_9ZZZZ
MVALAFPLVAHERRQALRRRWSCQLLDIVNVRLETRGRSPTGGSMLVANHISWLDIYAISAIQPAAFVSKSELRGWPLIGWLAARTDTIFLQRGSRSHARVVNEEIGRVLRSGGNVAVFPEGTTTDGTELLHFHAALLQPAISTGRPVQPLALAYRDRAGQPSSAAAYAGETTMWQSLLRLAREPGMVLIIEVLPALATESGDRRAIAALARATIAERLALAPRSG